MRVRIIIHAASLICAAAWAAADVAAQTTAARVDTVQLRFGWPAGTDVRIESTRFQERSAETTDTVAGSAQYRMKVQAHVEGLLVSYQDFVFPPAADTTESAKLSSLAEQAAAVVPKFIVDATGTFVRIQDVATVRARLDTLMTRMLPPDEAAAARESLATLLTEDALTGLAAQEWNAIVGMWADADLEPGTVYRFEELASLPMIPGASVPMLSEYSIAGRTPCSEGGAGEDCVEIHLVSHPDPAALKEILAQFMQQLLSTPGLGGIAFESLDMRNEMVLVTEPSTLRPHRVRMSKSVRGVVSAEGERSEVSQLEVRTFRYTYMP